MQEFLKTSIDIFKYYKSLGEKAIDQISVENLFTHNGIYQNSIAVIIKHLHGNMVSRWTDIFTTDGEKPNRNRDSEFTEFLPEQMTKEYIMQLWSAGWERLFKALQTIEPDEYKKLVYIRNQGHTLTEAISRQLAHYAYHVGQIVYIAKQHAESWNSLSIPLNQSSQFNQQYFDKEKSSGSFFSGNTSS